MTLQNQFKANRAEFTKPITIEYRDGTALVWVRPIADLTSVFGAFDADTGEYDRWMGWNVTVFDGHA